MKYNFYDSITHTLLDFPTTITRMKRNIYDYVMEKENYKRGNCMHNFNSWNHNSGNRNSYGHYR